MLFFVHDPCMATKTITLELDAYEKLRLSKRPGESFTEVVRRARFDDSPPTGADLLRFFRSGGSGLSEECLDAVEIADRNDLPPDNPWA